MKWLTPGSKNERSTRPCGRDGGEVGQRWFDVKSRRLAVRLDEHAAGGRGRGPPQHRGCAAAVPGKDDVVGHRH